MMRTWLYLPTGNKMEFEFTESSIPEDDYANALAYTNRLLALGASVNAPGLEEGEQSELIVTVMRRAKDDGTPIIDFYPEWGFGGEPVYGTYKHVHKYMNDEDIPAFLAASGFKSLEDIPLYDGQSSLVRKEGKVHKLETPVPTPFKAVKKQGKERIGSDGKPYRAWELIRYESVGTPTQQPPANSASSSAAGNKATDSQTATGNAANSALPTNTDQLTDILNIVPSGAQWTRIRKWLFVNVYESNQFAIDGSMKRHATLTNNWKRGDGSQMTVRDIITYLQTRHDGEKQGLQDAS